MTHGASGIRASKIRGMRVNLLILIQRRSRGLLLRRVFRDRVAAIKAKAAAIRAKVRVNHSKMGGISGMLVS